MEKTLNNELQVKFRRLQNFLQNQQSAGILFSGGTDSALLLFIASQLDNLKVTAFTMNSVFFPGWELQRTIEFTRKYNITHEIIEFSPLSNKDIAANSTYRCYFCKEKGFGLIRDFCRKNNMTTLSDGSCTDDLSDHRPGMQALKELDIVSPFIDYNISKKDITELMLYLNLQEWQKPSCACLASRIPYGQKITEKTLKTIEAAEVFLHTLDLPEARVRMHFNLARIEVYPENMKKAFDNRDVINGFFKTLSIDYTTLDLQGYRSGSLNETINNQD